MATQEGSQETQLFVCNTSLSKYLQANQFVSTMKMNFQKGTDPVQQAVIPEKINVSRASHFELGGQRNNYITSSKIHYQPHLNFQTAALDDEKKHDLRTNHFVLGHQDGNRTSVTKQTYETKPLQPNILLEQEIQKTKMRAHHHKFAETNTKMMRTFYNEQYQGYKQEDLLQQKTKEELVERVVGLRQSHIVLGKEQIPMHSIQQSDFNMKEGQLQQAIKVPPQQSHFALGNEQTEYKTVTQEFHTQKPIQQVDFSADNQQNLRTTHFILGQEGQSYKTETMQTYMRPSSQQPIDYKNNTKALQKNHFELGDARFPKLGYQTQYNQAMKPPASVATNQQQPGQTARDQKADRGSNFQIGSMGIQYKSEFNSNFNKGREGQPASLDPRVMKDLRSSHFGFTNPTNQFQTTNKQSYIGGQGQPNQLDPNAAANLRSHHFLLGQTKPNYVSTTKDIHRQINEKPNQLNAQLAKDLRTHHFQFS